MEKKKKLGAGRVILRVLGVLLGLIVLAAAFFLLVPLAEKADTTPVEGSAERDHAPRHARLRHAVCAAGLVLEVPEP